MSTIPGGSSGGAVPSLSLTRVRGIFERMGIWLDARSVRSYPQDMHSWASKMETLRSLKVAAQQSVRRLPCSILDLRAAAGHLGASGGHDLRHGVAASHSG